MKNLKSIDEAVGSILERRAAADRLLKDVINGNASEVEGIKLSKEMAQGFLDWLKYSTYGKKFGALPFYKLFTASFNWGLDRFVKGANTKLKDEFKELKAKASEMRKAEKFESVDEAIDLLNTPEHLGLSTCWNDLDEFYRVSPSEVTVVTGVPNMGKSEWMDALMINMVQEYGWKFGIFSAENFPVKHHLLKLVGKFAGKPFYGEEKMSEEIARNSMEILDDHIKFIGTQENSVTIASIMEQARLLNYRYGLNGLVIDPWNTLEHKFGDGENETNYVSRVLSELTAFAKISELHIWVVAHPRKMENDVNRKPVVPSPYDISGSANWFNKADNAITIHRHRSEDDDYVGVHVHKIRFQYKNGKTGVGKLNYNVRTGKYETYIERPEENLFG